MKKIKVLAIALALALTTTGCKKEEASMSKDTTSINSDYIHLTNTVGKKFN